jgi:hypothetical protein
MPRLSFRFSHLSLAALFAASLAYAVGCMALGDSGSSDTGATGVGGGVILPGSGGASSSDGGDGGDVTTPYLMGSYAYLCGGPTATCVPGISVCSSIDPTKNDAGLGGASSTSSGTGTSSGSTGGSDGTSSSGDSGSSTSTSTSSAGGTSGTSSSSSSSSSGDSGSSTASGTGGSSGDSGSSSASGTGGSSAGVGGSGAGGSSSASGAGGTSAGVGGGGGSSSSSGSSDSSTGVGSSTGAGTGSTGSGSTSDGGAPISFTCKLSPANGKALAACTAVGDGLVSDPCQTAADCSAGLACIATPSGGICRPYCCNQVEDCPADTYCAPTPMAEANVKIPVCLPAYSCKVLDERTCPPGQTCTIVRDDGTASCVELGDGQRGDACPCAQGHVCSKFTNTCLKLCHLGNDVVDCGAGSCQGGVAAYPDGIGICAGYP